MKIPNSFIKLTLGFRQGTLEAGVPESQIIEDSIAILSPAERLTAKSYLSELLERDSSVAQLQNIWNSSSASYYISDDRQLKSLLQLILIKLN